MRDIKKIYFKRFVEKLRLTVLYNKLIRKSSYCIAREKYKEFSKSFDESFTNPISNTLEPRKKVLIVCLESIYFSTALIEEAILAKSLELNNADVHILLERGSMSECYFKRLGLGKFIYYDDYYLEFFNRKIKPFNSFTQLFSIKYKNVAVGKHVTSTFMRVNHSGFFEVNQNNNRTLKKLLKFSHCFVDGIEKIQYHHQFDKAFFLERGYSPNGEIFDFFISKGVDCIQWCGSHKENSFIFKRYNSNNANTHPAGISKLFWDQIKNNLDHQEIKKEVYRELYYNYNNQTWFSEVGTQFNTIIKNKKDIIEELDLDPSKKTAIIFSHLFWDATFFWGDDLYKDYKEWYLATIDIASKNPTVNWIVKIHPANIVKLNRSGFTGELSEILAIKEKFASLPTNIKFIYPNTQISTFSLFEVMDYCITVRGTIGLEAAAMGVTTITAGTGRYDSFGFTRDSLSISEYEEKLKNIHHVPTLSENEIALANLMAYYTFIKKPITLTSFTFKYLKDQVASCVFTYNFQSLNDIKNAKDLNLISEWVLNSNQEDLFNS